MKTEVRNVLITGGASGLGLGFARALAAKGMRIVIADANGQAGAEIEEELQKDNHRVKFLQVDVTSPKSVAEMLRNALQWLPDDEALDAAVFSAGINGNQFDITPEDPSALSNPGSLDLVGKNAATLNVNLVAMLQCIQLTIKYGMGLNSSTDSWTGPSEKSVTLVGSLASYRALPSAADYSAAKWGVRGMFRSLRQLAPKVGVRVNLVAPGFVRTPLLGSRLPLYEKLGIHFAKEEDVVDAVVKAVSDKTCSGTSFAITAEGLTELVDDASDMEGGIVMNDLAARGAFGIEGCAIGYDHQRVTFK